jgi:hypothetical protein
LHFPFLLGEKIILYGSASYNYGIGIQANQLQIHADQPASAIEFGNGSNSNFTELMRINGNGRVGIGTNDPQARLDVVKGSNLATAAFFPNDINGGKNSHFNYGSSEYTYIRGNKIILNDVPGGKVGIGIEPTFADAILEVNGRINIRKYAFTNKGGYWLNRSNNLSVAALVSMEENLIGFTGMQRGKFQMDANTGALRIEYSFGNAGQVLQSRGTADYARWVSTSNSVYNGTTVLSPGIYTVYAGAAPVDLPGTTYIFSLPGNATLLVSFNIGVQIPFDEERFANAYVDLVFDNVVLSRSGCYIDYRTQTITGTAVITTGPGGHFIKLKAFCTDWSVYFNPEGGKGLFVQIINK